MEYKNLLTNVIQQWNFTRSETLEILNSLDESQLQFKPEGEKWQSISHQFGCIGRTQLVYAKAIETGKMDFSYFASKELPSKDQFQTKAELATFLEEANQRWLEIIMDKEEEYTIQWPGMKMSLVQQIASLAEHERLHHGQLISYFTLAGFKLPKKFRDNWAL